MNLPEQKVLTELKEGSENAFEMLFKTYYQPLCNYAYSFLNDKDEAEEVVQSAFITIWDKREAIEIQTSVRPYLYRMVRNASLNRIKHAKVKTEYAQHQTADGEPVYDGAEQGILSDELEKKIHNALGTLPQQCRLVFQLSRVEELTYAQIADQLNISVKTVENQMGKALRILRIQLKEYLPVLLILFKFWM